MPAAYAHYVFGKKVFQEFSGTEKEIIRKGEDAFLLGLHGPDLLFYYFPLCKNRINQQGVKLHKKIAAEFFELGRKRRQKDGQLGSICTHRRYTGLSGLQSKELQVRESRRER
mgnify:CR=1 FL=1